MISADEDAYWERRREEFENPRTSYMRSVLYEKELEYESGRLFLDEKIEEIEEVRGCPIEELQESDLLEILDELKGIKGETARWCRTYLSINYTVRVA